MKSVVTLPRTIFNGRRFTRKQLAQVQETVQRFPALSRTELARTLCEHLNWKTPNGKHKVESCLTLLEKLEAQGVVRLPAKQVRQAPQRRVPVLENDAVQTPIEAALSTLMPIRLEAVGFLRTGPRAVESLSADLPLFGLPPTGGSASGLFYRLAAEPTATWMSAVFRLGRLGAGAARRVDRLGSPAPEKMATPGAEP